MELATIGLANCAREKFCTLRASRPLVKSRARGGNRDRAQPVSDQKRAMRMFVSGRVQGVGYRQFVHGVAKRMGVAGYVRNLADGRVEVYAIGSDAQLRALLAELRRGPRHAIV